MFTINCEVKKLKEFKQYIFNFQIIILVFSLTYCHSHPGPLNSTVCIPNNCNRKFRSSRCEWYVLILVDLSIVFFLLDLYSTSGFKITFLKRNLHFLSHQEIGKRVFNQLWRKFLAKIKNSQTQFASLWRVSLANCSTYQKNKNRAGTICIRKVKDLPFYLCLWIMIIEECWYFSNTHTLPHLPTTHTSCVSLGKSFNFSTVFFELQFSIQQNGSWTWSYVYFYSSDSFNSKTC